MFVITAIAAVALMVFIFGMLPHFNSANLFDIAVNTEAAGASSFLPLGYLGIWAAVPDAIGFLQLKGCHSQPRKPKSQPNPCRVA